MFLFITLASLQIYGSEQNSIPTSKKRQAYCLEAESSLSTVKSESVNIRPKISLVNIPPKISLTDDEVKSQYKNKIRNGLLCNNQGCIVVIKELLSDQDRIVSNQSIEHTITQAVLNNDITTLKMAIEAMHNLSLKKALLPSIARWFPRNPISLQDFRDKTGSSLLHLTCSKYLKFEMSNHHDIYRTQKTNILNYLIEQNIDVNAQDDNGNTAIHNAMLYAYRNFQHIEMLKRAGANLNVQNNNGETPLLVLAKNMNIHNANKNHQLLEELVLYGADINITDNQGQSVINILRSAYSGNYNLEKTMEICKNLGAKN